MPVLLSLLISRSINRSELRTSYPILKFFAKVIFDNLYFFNSLDSSFDNKRGGGGYFDTSPFLLNK